VPVVSTAVLGTKEVLRDAAGAIVVAENVTEFTSAVVEVLTQPALRGALGNAGRQFVAQNWSSLEMAKRLAQLYDQVAARAS
jgi:1,2-diacylglycerol 3-alpha-glucosyltransferase